MNPNVVARIAVTTIGAAALAFGSVGAVAAFTGALAPDQVGTKTDVDDPAGRRELDRVMHAQLECIRQDLEGTLAPGSVVYVPLDPATPGAELWQQRLTEMAFPLATVAPAPGPGIVTLTIARDDTGGGCTGVLLVTTTGSA